MSETVNLDNVRSIADMTIGPDDISEPDPTKPAVKVVSLLEFVSKSDQVAAPVLGTPDDALLPEDGLLLMYGDGGAGKTTLSVDAMAHLASGTPWLGITVPRALRVMLIENEGPRGPFRRRLHAKIASWDGEPFAPNVVVLEEPWTRFALTDETFRHQLADEINGHQVDVVIVGPLASLGAKGTGTPDEVNEFDLAVQDFRARARKPFALWIVHHENKAGDVSGAWERWPDSLVHVQAQGNGRTRIHWRKIRWSSTLHGTSSNLLWKPDTSGFIVEEKQDRDFRGELLEAMANGETLTSTDWSRQTGIRRQTVSDLITALLEQGLITRVAPIPGRAKNSVGWVLTSACPDTLGQAGQADLFQVDQADACPPVRPYKGQDRAGQADDPAASSSGTPGQAPTDEAEIERLQTKYADQLGDDGIPF